MIATDWKKLLIISAAPDSKCISLNVHCQPCTKLTPQHKEKVEYVEKT